MSLLASSAKQVLVNACTNKCENRKTSSWLQTKNESQLLEPNRHFMWEFCFFYFSLSEKILTCHVQKDCLELPYTVTEFWHAMNKRWGSAVLPDKEVISHTEQVLKDGQEASLILLVHRIHLLQYFKAMIGISILNQLRKSWHIYAPNFTRFYKASKSLNPGLNKTWPINTEPIPISLFLHWKYQCVNLKLTVTEIMAFIFLFLENE